MYRHFLRVPTFGSPNTPFVHEVLSVALRSDQYPFTPYRTLAFPRNLHVPPSQAQKTHRVFAGGGGGAAGVAAQARTSSSRMHPHPLEIDSNEIVVDVLLATNDPLYAGQSRFQVASFTCVSV